MYIFLSVAGQCDGDGHSFVTHLSINSAVANSPRLTRTGLPPAYHAHISVLSTQGCNSYRFRFRNFRFYTRDDLSRCLEALGRRRDLIFASTALTLQ